jgi:integrase
MPKQKITTKLVADTVKMVKILPLQDHEYRDTELAGFFVRVSKKGKVTWYVEKWFNGKGNIQKKIGSMPSMGLDDARKAAQIVIGQLASGVDVSKIKSERLAKQIAATKAPTLGQLYSEYFKGCRDEASRYHREQRQAFDKWIQPELGMLPASQISKADLRGLIAGLEDSPRRQVFALLSKFYKWMSEHDYLTANPMAALSRPAPPRERQRIMSDAEIRAYWSAAERLGYPQGDFYKVALLLGQRKDETRLMEWAELDMAKQTWTIPAEKTKTESMHLVHLSDQAMDVLMQCPRYSRYVFSFDEGRVAMGSDPWIELLCLMTRPEWSLAELRRAAPDYKDKAKLVAVEPVLKLHDARRTMSSRMIESCKVSPHVADKVQNHKLPTTIRKAYQVYELLDERREAIEVWGRYIGGLVGAG